jgi:peptidyl-dipeptidase Dcp
MTNPLLQKWSTPFEMPPFEIILAAHFPEAFNQALSSHQAEIQAIANQINAPSFQNTLLALEASGELLNQTSAIFFNLSASHTSPEIQAIEREISPKLAAHSAAMFLNAALFERIDKLHAERASLGIDSESIRLIERYHLDFVRAGARLKDKDRQSFAEYAEKLASCFSMLFRLGRRRSRHGPVRRHR